MLSAMSSSDPAEVTMEVDPSSTSSSVAVVVDALPYIDVGYEEQGVREAVRHQVIRRNPAENVASFLWLMTKGNVTD